METLDDTQRQAVAWYQHLSQGETWVPNGQPPLPIADMDAGWRYNAANWLLKRAETLVFLYQMGEALALSEPIGTDVLTGQPVFVEAPPEVEFRWGSEDLERLADPEAWLKTTELYQALVSGLREDAAELAKHWSDCGLRTGQGSVCSCWQRHIIECPVYSSRDISGPCHCRDNSPEWVDD